MSGTDGERNIREFRRPKPGSRVRARKMKEDSGEPKPIAFTIHRFAETSDYQAGKPVLCTIFEVVEGGYFVKTERGHQGYYPSNQKLTIGDQVLGTYVTHWRGMPLLSERFGWAVSKVEHGQYKRNQRVKSRIMSKDDSFYLIQTIFGEDAILKSERVHNIGDFVFGRFTGFAKSALPLFELFTDGNFDA